MSASEDENILTSSESSSEDDENTDLIKEAAQCDYVHKLYRNAFSANRVDRPTKKFKSESHSEETTISSHQVYIAKRLSERLDKLIEFVETPVSLPKKSPSPSKGIQLLSDSVFIDEVEQDDIVTTKRPNSSHVLSYKEHVSRAKEVAVTCDWVLSKANTSLWTSNKKPKIINLAVVDKSPEGKLECDIVSKVNIPDKFKLV